MKRPDFGAKRGDGPSASDGPLHVRPVSLLPILRDVVQTAVSERRIRIDIACEDTMGALADERLLASAIGNLVQNAITFSIDGAHVSLRARTEGEGVLIEVEDECGGLPVGSAERMFERFVQGGGDREGVGLESSRDAVAAMFGTLRVRDLPGEGCIFEIRLRDGASARGERA